MDIKVVLLGTVKGPIGTEKSVRKNLIILVPLLPWLHFKYYPFGVNIDTQTWLRVSSSLFLYNGCLHMLITCQNKEHIILSDDVSVMSICEILTTWYKCKERRRNGLISCFFSSKSQTFLSTLLKVLKYVILPLPRLTIHSPILVIWNGCFIH